MTTPIAFITSRPLDPFKVRQNLGRLFTAKSADREDEFYDYYTIISTDEFRDLSRRGHRIFILPVDASGLLANAANRKYGKWLMWSVGPDKEYWILQDDFSNATINAVLKTPIHNPWGYSFDVPYDPSNGTISFGNLIRTQLTTDGANKDRELD